MIKELKLKNWKSFDSESLYIDPLSILIGTNASGKSNIIDAFLFLYRLAWGKHISSAIDGDNELSPIRGGGDWMIRRGEYECELSVVVEHSATIDYSYTIGFLKNNNQIVLGYEGLDQIVRKPRGGNSVKRLFYTDSSDNNDLILPVYFSTETQGRGKRVDMGRTLAILSQIEVLGVRNAVKEAGLKVLEKLKGIFILDPIPNHMRSYSKLSANLQSDAANIAGVLAALPDGKREETEDVLTKYVALLPERDIVKVWSEKVGLFKSDAMLYCREKWIETDTIDMDSRGMSDGTLRFIAIVTALLTVKPQSILIIEEIDNGLHPSRASKLVAVLNDLGRKRQIDVLCTTHNPALLDALGNQMIPYIAFLKRNKHTGHSTINMMDEVGNLAKIMASDTIGGLMTKGVFEQYTGREESNG